MKNRNQAVDNLRGFLTVLVVFGHAVIGVMGRMPNRSVIQNPWLLTVTLIYSFHMPAFFVLSGFFFSTASDMDGDKMRKGIYHKFLTLAVPYVLCSVGYWVVKGCMSFAVSAKMSWRDLYMIPVRPIEFFWFLYALFFVNLFAYFNVWICRKEEIIFILLGVLAFFYSDQIYLAAVSYVWKYMVYFYLGILLKKYRRYLDKGWLIWGSLAGYVVSVLALLYCVPDIAGITSAMSAQYSGYKLFCGIFASVFLIGFF